MSEIANSNSNNVVSSTSNIIDQAQQHLDNILIDPISLMTMEDPILTQCGHSFDRDTIEEWLVKKSTCPLCHKEISKDQLTPNYSLKEIINHLSTIQRNSSSIIINNNSNNNNNNSINIESNSNISSNSSNVSNTSDNNNNNELLSSKITMLANQLADLSSKLDNKISQQQQLQSQSIINAKREINYVIREIWKKEIKDCAKLMERSTRNDPFMCYFFQGESWTQSGSEWYFACMLTYALKRARVWGVFDKVTGEMMGSMICQPPFESGVRIVEMLKAGMMLATYKMGIAPLTRVLNLFQVTERVHGQTTRGIPHWYVNAIIVDIDHKRKYIGTDLINTVCQLADSQKVSVYIDTADPESLKFLEKLNFKIKHHSNDNKMVEFWALMRDPTQ